MFILKLVFVSDYFCFTNSLKIYFEIFYIEIFIKFKNAFFYIFSLFTRWLEFYLIKR